jgi:1,4-alpha-glucan branching enzyme
MGSGKDWSVWDGAQVADLAAAGAEVQRRLLGAVDKDPPTMGRDALLDALATQALLALSSDWAFMVSKRSAPEYARARAELHAGRVHELVDLLGAGRRVAAAHAVRRWADQDDAFGHLDARWLRAGDRCG